MKTVSDAVARSTVRWLHGPAAAAGAVVAIARHGWLFALAALLSSCYNGGDTTAERLPPRDYLILINYELGMHCTGFDFAYCCVLPPYNSILAQVVKTERAGRRPVLLEAAADNREQLVDGDRRFKLAYRHEDPDGVPNSYSASKKLIYWGVPYRDGVLPDYEFSHLYIYSDLEGGHPPRTSADDEKRFIGLDLPIRFNRGPTGQHVGQGFLRYSGDGGTVVFTDSRVMENVPIKLTNPGIWEALGLPLTPFNDDFTALINLDETMVQPYQTSVVTLVDADTEAPVIDSSGDVVRFFGVNPIDVPNCARCHANERANGTEFVKYKQEYAFWKSMRGSSEWYAELKAAAISILEIHDARNGTDFLRHWPAGANTYNRLGRDSVMCQGCHADNVIGQLRSLSIAEMSADDRRPGYSNRLPPEHRIAPLTEAVHTVHQRKLPMPDRRGLAGGCQLCHPAHRSDRSMDEFPLTKDGRNRFADGDVRDAKGCFTRRDVHGNPRRNSDGAGTASYLNPVGEFLLNEVMPADGVDKGLYCTHCHNRLSRELYKADRLQDAVLQTGETLRGRTPAAIATALGLSLDELLHDYLDPVSPTSGEDTGSGVYRVWAREGQAIADLARIEADDEGRPLLTAPDRDGDRSVIVASTDPAASEGIAVSYDAATDGRDYWLAAGEPHCADCHEPPFVESMGGGAFPIDQPGKYALMRYSKGHAGITCQGCHESPHGLYPVNPDVDVASYRQAASLNPDGSHGPVRCGACHSVDRAGVPMRYPEMIEHTDTAGAGYEAAVELQHRLR